MDTVRTRTRGRTQEFVRQSGGHAAHKPILVSLVVGVFSASTFAYLYYDPPPYFQKFENQLRDYMFPSRGSIPTDDAVVFCNIDDEAAEVIGQWPLPRTYYSQLINALSESNTIGFDILFLERGMISNSEAVEATNKFRGLLEVVQRLLGGEEEKQQETLQHLSDIFKSASASIGGPDGLLALSASEHKRILFPMAFPEEYSGRQAMEESHRKYQEIASLIQNKFLRYATKEKVDELSKGLNEGAVAMNVAKENSASDELESPQSKDSSAATDTEGSKQKDKPDIYDIWFLQSPFQAMLDLKKKLAGKPGLTGEHEQYEWDYIERDLMNIIPRVNDIDKEFVLSLLEREGFIFKRRDLEEAGYTYTDILVEGYNQQFLAEEGQLENYLDSFFKLELIERTLVFLNAPRPLFNKFRKLLISKGVHQQPFDLAHRQLFAEAFGKMLVENFQGNEITEQLESQIPETRDLDKQSKKSAQKLYQAIDMFVRELITDKVSPRINSLLIDEQGEPLRTQDEQEAAAGVLKTAYKSYMHAKTPLVPLSLAAAEPCMISVSKDFDGAVRRYPMVTVRGDRAFFAMGLVMACNYLQVKPKDIRICPGKFILLPGAKFRDGRQEDIRVPIDMEGNMVINWAGEFKDARLFKHYSFNRVLDSSKYRSELKDKLVLVGYTATASHDVAPNPFQGNYPLVGAHANVINSILTQNFLQPEIRSRRHANILVICFASMLMALGTALLSQHWSGIVQVAATVTYYLVASGVFALWGEPLNVSFTIFGITFSFGGVLLYRYMTEERQKKVVKAMFSTMVSPEVLEYLQESPDRFKLIGEKKLATMFFSDVAGFTTISESLTAEDLAKVLNEYLTPMSNIIMKYGGYIDKYEGDAIMADFGVPLWKDEEEPNSHAWKCCWSALDQMKKLREIQFEIRTQYGCDIDVRMGINTGDVSAGNMGSEQKFQYTVMGDAVNQAARFEPANKEFDTHIMIGEPTYLYAQHKIEARKLAALVVKGKTEPVICYELVGKKGEVSDEMLHLIEKFETGWRHHAIQDFEKAIEYFDECLAIDPKDGPSIRYKGICEDLIKEPPDPAWRGEFIQTSK